VKQFRTVATAILLGDFAAAEKLLNPPPAGGMPPQFLAARLFMQGTLAMGHDQYSEALGYFDRAESLRPDLPALPLLRAACYLRTGQPRKAIAAGEQYLALIGPNARTYAMIGTAYERLDQIPLALIAYRQGLADDPDNTTCREALTRLDVVPGRSIQPTPPKLPGLPSPKDFRL
jgi:predicted Zn-dependent protease